MKENCLALGAAIQPSGRGGGVSGFMTNWADQVLVASEGSA